MRSRSLLAFVAVLALLVTACSGQSGTSQTPDDEESASEVASASGEASEEPSEEPSEDASGKPSVEPSEEPSEDELDYSLPPNFGSDDLTSGFTPDPFSADVVSGGPIDASYLGNGCGGWATAAPDYDITYTAGDLSLLRFYFVADSGEDTTLIVNAPDVEWYCSDDSNGTLDPAVDFEDPATGLYDIWVGSYESGATVSGTLYVTELDSNHP
jgi:hypothetical protein